MKLNLTTILKLLPVFLGAQGKLIGKFLAVLNEVFESNDELTAAKIGDTVSLEMDSENFPEVPTRGDKSFHVKTIVLVRTK